MLLSIMKYGKKQKYFFMLRIYGKTYLEKQTPDFLRRIVHVLDLMRMLTTYSGDARFETWAIEQEHHKEVNMIAALKECWDDARNIGLEDGRKEGRKEGRGNLNVIYADLFKAGRVEDVQRAVQDPEYLKQIMSEYGYKEED